MNEHPAVTIWQEKVLAPSLAKSPERQAQFKTGSNLPVARVALPEGIDDAYLARLGLPGQYPFTRGIHPTMYRARLWTMRQYAGYSTAEETNARFRYLLEQGTNGLSVAFDLPTQLGYDSDHEMSAGEVGRVGVAIDSLADMERLFENIPLGRISTSMTINAPAAVLLAMYVAVAEKQGVRPDQLTGTLQNDILKEYIARGTYIFGPRPSLRLAVDILAWCHSAMPRFNPISISGYHIREAGATAVQEVAFTLADGCAYVRAALEAGLEVDQFAPRLAFFFNACSDLLEEVAKFRAARRLWARLMKERFGARKPASMMLRFHAQTAGHTLAAQQAENNVVRVTLQALAAVLGGAQSLHTNSQDEAVSLPTEEAVQTALRTQQIIAHESGVASTVDPLGGSYFVEQLTDEMERSALVLLDRIEAMGGMVAAIEAGFPQGEIEEAAYRVQREIENREKIIVGVNQFQSEEFTVPRRLRLAEPKVRGQLRKLAELRERRDATAVRDVLARLERAAGTDENLMPVLLEAVRAYATLGEICGVLRGVFGEHEERPRAEKAP